MISSKAQTTTFDIVDLWRNRRIGVSDTVVVPIVVTSTPTAPVANVSDPVTLTPSSVNGTSLVGTDSVGVSLKVRTLTSDQTIEISVDPSGGEVNIRAILPQFQFTRHIEPNNINVVVPPWMTLSRLSHMVISVNTPGAIGGVSLVMLDTLYWNGTQTNIAASMFLDSPGYFYTSIHGLQSNTPFNMYATVVCLVPFHLSFSFAMASAPSKKWIATLSSVVDQSDKMQRIRFNVLSSFLEMSTELVPRPMLDTNTTSPGVLFGAITQTTSGIYSPNGTNLSILGLEFVFG
jgi:hypothetical protein